MSPVCLPRHDTAMRSLCLHLSYFSNTDKEPMCWSFHSEHWNWSFPTVYTLCHVKYCLHNGHNTKYSSHCLWEREPRQRLMWWSAFPVDSFYSPRESPTQSRKQQTNLLLLSVDFMDYMVQRSDIKTQSKELKESKFRATIYVLFIVSFHKLINICPFKVCFTVNKSHEKTKELTPLTSIFWYSLFLCVVHFIDVLYSEEYCHCSLFWVSHMVLLLQILTRPPNLWLKIVPNKHTNVSPVWVMSA